MAVSPTETVLTPPFSKDNNFGSQSACSILVINAVSGVFETGSSEVPSIPFKRVDFLHKH
jgi:hypothetical protein